MSFSQKRQEFIVDQGYSFNILENFLSEEKYQHIKTFRTDVEKKMYYEKVLKTMIIQ